MRRMTIPGANFAATKRLLLFRNYNFMCRQITGERALGAFLNKLLLRGNYLAFYRRRLAVLRGRVVLARRVLIVQELEDFFFALTTLVNKHR